MKRARSIAAIARETIAFLAVATPAVGAAAVVLASSSPAFAATPEAAARPASFETLTLAVSGLATSSDASIHDDWDPGASGELSAWTPFGRGFLEVAFQPFASEPRTSDLPRVRTLVTSLGWGAGLRLPAELTFRTSARTAVAWMLYDASGERAAQDENELAFGVRAELERRVGSGWAAHAGVRAVRVLTRERIDLVFAGAGVSWTFAAPAWMRAVLE